MKLCAFIKVCAWLKVECFEIATFGLPQNISRHCMRQTTNKILTTFLTTFFVFNLAFGQTIKEDEKEIKLDPYTEKNVSMLIDSLAGTWELVKTVRYEKNDTIVQEPSTQLWLTPGAKPFTTITIDSLRNFQIEQVCLKCPYLFWTGQYEIEIRTFKGIGFFYINFVDRRLKVMKSKKQKKTFTLEFNGHLTNFENGKLTLTDKEGTEWIYKRLKI